MNSIRKHILILGGTTEARQLAQQAAPRSDWFVTLSLAGRTAAPLTLPVSVRRGGFSAGGGLGKYLREHRVAALIDATHPYAARISAQALSAAGETRTPLLGLRRLPWTAVAGDRWTEVLDANEAVSILGSEPRCVFLALGRQEIAAFGLAPQHHYLIRSIDPVQPPLAVPHARYILGRGPFEEDDERALLLGHTIDVVVAKNSGSAATYGKIAAARTLGLPVIMLRRPTEPPGPRVTRVAEVMAWLDHVLGTGCDRGV